MDEDNLDVHDSFPNINDTEEWLPLFPETVVNDDNEEGLDLTSERPVRREVSCPSFLVNGYCMDRDDCPFIHDAAMTSTSDSSSKLPDGLKPFKDPGLTMNRKELKVWKALCALEDELEVGWLPICREAINSDDGSTKNKQERLGLINGIHSNILGKLRRIEELSKPDIKAKRSYIVEKVNKLLAELGVTGGSR